MFNISRLNYSNAVCWRTEHLRSSGLNITRLHFDFAFIIWVINQVAHYTIHLRNGDVIQCSTKCQGPGRTIFLAWKWAPHPSLLCSDHPFWLMFLRYLLALRGKCGASWEFQSLSFRDNKWNGMVGICSKHSNKYFQPTANLLAGKHAWGYIRDRVNKHLKSNVWLLPSLTCALETPGFASSSGWNIWLGFKQFLKRL